MIIFQENIEHRDEVNNIIKKAFAKESFSDQTEHLLVPRIRKSESYIPQLSLVAKKDNELVGHILFSKIDVKNELKSFKGLALAPVSVLPDYQNQGIGSALIKEGHKIAKSLGYKFIILVGHEKYYLRFGYELLPQKISLPFPAPRNNCFALDLTNGSLSEVSGVVSYDDAFGI